MGSDKRNDENERFILVALDEIACVPLEKIGLGQLQRQIANGQRGEESILVVGHRSLFDQEPAVIANAFHRYPFLKPSLGRSLIAQMPFSDVAGAIPAAQKLGQHWHRTIDWK